MSGLSRSNSQASEDGPRSLGRRQVSPSSPASHLGNDEGYVEGEGAYDWSYEITDTKGLDGTSVRAGGNTLTGREYRDKVLAARAHIIQEQRDLLAQQWMRDQSPALVKALSDPDYARKNGIKVVLEIADVLVSIVPPETSGSVNENDLEACTNYVQSSVVNMINELPLKNELKADIKANEKKLKTFTKELKTFGVKVDERVQKGMLKETRVVLELRDGSGIVRGEPLSKIHVPYEAVKNRPASYLNPSAVRVVSADEGSLYSSNRSESVPASEHSQRFSTQGEEFGEQEQEWEWEDSASQASEDDVTGEPDDEVIPPDSEPELKLPAPLEGQEEDVFDEETEPLIPPPEFTFTETSAPPPPSPPPPPLPDQDHPPS